MVEELKSIVAHCCVAELQYQSVSRRVPSGVSVPVNPEIVTADESTPVRRVLLTMVSVSVLSFEG